MKKTPTKGQKRVREPAQAATAGSRAGLAREQLVEASIDLLQETGLDAFSTRNLAERLGVRSPALYWHVRNKEELLSLVADAICAKMSLPPAHLSFRKRLEGIASEYRCVLLAHRDASRLFAEYAPIGPHRIKLYDAAVGAFLDAGFVPAEAIAMATFYRHFLLGMITEEARHVWSREAKSMRPTTALGEELSHLGQTSHDYPNLHGSSTLLASIEPEALFHGGLKMLLDGMECRVAEIADSKQRTSPAKVTPAKAKRRSP